MAIVAALRLRVREGKFREPDLLLLRDRSDPRCQDRYWLGADLVVEVVSRDDPDRGRVEKRGDYTEAGIPEYWIADPADETITVLALEGGAYVEVGVHGRGDAARSRLLSGFAAEVTAVSMPRSPVRDRPDAPTLVERQVAGRWCRSPGRDHSEARLYSSPSSSSSAVLDTT